MDVYLFMNVLMLVVKEKITVVIEHHNTYITVTESKYIIKINTC